MMKGKTGKMNKKDFRRITEMLEENYNKKMDIRIFSLWYEEFKDFTSEQYEKMVIDAIKTKKFMPTLAEIKELKRPRWFDIEVKKIEIDDDDKKMLEELLREFQ